MSRPQAPRRSRSLAPSSATTAPPLWDTSPWLEGAHSSRHRASTRSCWPSSRSWAATSAPRTRGARAPRSGSSAASCTRARLCASVWPRRNDPRVPKTAPIEARFGTHLGTGFHRLNNVLPQAPIYKGLGCPTVLAGSALADGTWYQLGAPAALRGDCRPPWTLC